MKRKQKDCKSQWRWKTPRKENLLDTRGLMPTQTPRGHDSNPKSGGDPVLRGDVDTKSPSITRSYLQITARKGNISFLKWSLTGYTNHTWGQTLCPAVGDYHKKEVNGTFGGFFFWFYIVLSGHLKRILTCRSFAVYDGFWFCTFMRFLCVGCVSLYVSCVFFSLALFKKICSFAYLQVCLIVY